jgi:hypothetical protein
MVLRPADYRQMKSPSDSVLLEQNVLKKSNCPHPLAQRTIWPVCSGCGQFVFWSSDLASDPSALCFPCAEAAARRQRGQKGGRQ